MTPKKSTPKKAAKKAVKKASPKKKSAKKKAAEPEIVFMANTHVLVPKHEVLTEEEIAALFEQYNIQATNLPTISITDAGLTGLEVKMGDIIRVSRPSLTAGNSTFYRRVSNE